MRGQDLSIAKEFKEMGYGEALESDAAALEWLEKNKRKFGHFIDGKFTKPSNTFKTTNPANGKFLAEISKGNLSDIKLAVTSAVAAQKRWSSLNSHERAKYLYALARVIQKNSRILAVLETLENGKSIRETRDIDIPLVVRHFYHHAGWAEILHEEFRDYEPVGVAGQIIPWNFPLLMLSWKIAPALAAGNSVILKPAETTSLTAIYFEKICEMIGLPKGVVNIVTGDGETGEEQERCDSQSFPLHGRRLVAPSRRCCERTRCGELPKLHAPLHLLAIRRGHLDGGQTPRTRSLAALARLPHLGAQRSAAY